ncbi:MAG: hypothetical protein QOD58_3989 [Mycobacterium sp.]|nr:hypothetical protein [Mycobacterium sp.]
MTVARFGSVTRRRQVYKITYPNGMIYVGSDDTGSTYTYFGSPSAKQRIAADLAPWRDDLMVHKNILWESDTASKTEMLKKERELIVELGANDPAVGYNLTPRFRPPQ